MRPIIIAAGNIIVDHVIDVDKYPAREMLAHVHGETRCVGGSVCNTGIDLARLGGVEVRAVGAVGDDADGNFAIKEMQAAGIDCGGVCSVSDAPTSYALVISDAETHSRTFFHCRGANDRLTPERLLSADMRGAVRFHLGYLSLLTALDRPDPVCGTAAARCLMEMQNRGLRTSIDTVSDDDPENRDRLLCALKYCDDVIINEVEAGFLAQEDPYADGDISDENILRICKKIKAAGVRGSVIVHCPSRGWLYDGNELTGVDSMRLPKSEIVSSVGAGDAFCAGALYGSMYGMPAEELLRFANAAAACTLRERDSVSGMRPAEEVGRMAAEHYGHK